MNPDMLLGHMRDIRDIDAVPWWPLATGWWLLIGALALAILVLRFGRAPFLSWRQRRRERWRRDASRQLAALERTLDAEEPKTVAAQLSELLRRIAIARCGRDACAGLEGERWLTFLADNDPKRFPWAQHRRLLLEAPYAPPASLAGEKTLDDLKSLIRAARAWTKDAGSCVGTQSPTPLTEGGPDGH